MTRELASLIDLAPSEWSGLLGPDGLSELN